MTLLRRWIIWMLRGDSFGYSGQPLALAMA